MPVYNAGDYLIDAVASIIQQDMGDWELICINDGSTDTSGQTLERFAALDPRIRVLHQSNQGIVDALNAGCAMARAPLLCRMDCDDLAMPTRLSLQTQFLQKNPKCCVVGGAILEMDSDGDRLGVSRLPTAHNAIVDNLLHRKTGHFHPTTMIRAAALRAVDGYRKQYQWIEDHDLWLRLAGRAELANLHDVVLCYRQHASSVCWQRSEQQRELMNQLLTEAYRVRNLELPSGLLSSNLTMRTKAGPGKWARAAAKGGFPKTAYKHLRLLLNSGSPVAYKTRMTLETLLRIGLSLPSLVAQSSLRVPTFPEWHKRIASQTAKQATAA